MKIAIMELAKATATMDARAALDSVRTLAQAAEGLGYNRIWVAEHHNMSAIASSSPPVLVAAIAAATSTIRVGAGGVMLPNHAPYVVAEQFKLLDALYPGRIDLGLGRASGTDGATMRALRRSAQSAEQFPHDVQELQFFLRSPRENQGVVAYPAIPSALPVWILGTSLFGASLAAELGLPYAFASQFAPRALNDAIKLYRERFKPSDQLARPYVMAGVNVYAAETDDEAEFLSSTAKIFTIDIMRGLVRLLQPPIRDMSKYANAQELAAAGATLQRSIVGSPSKIREGIRRFVEETGVDEVIVNTETFDPDARRKSFEILATVNND